MTANVLTTVVVVLTLAASLAWAGEFRVTLLGTGTPTPRVDRFTQSTLIEAGQQTLLFDLGRGVTIRLWQAGIRLSSVTAHFLTHFHSDHTGGLPDLWLTGWLPPAQSLRCTATSHASEMPGPHLPATSTSCSKRAGPTRARLWSA